MYNFNEWENITSQNTKDSIEVNVCNKKLVFDKSIFPSSVKIRGKEILYAPIELCAEFANKKGVWENHFVIPGEQADKKITYTVSQSTEDIIVNADITIEFDGFIKVDFRIIPFWNIPWIAGEPQKNSLTRLYINIPVKNEFSTLMHYWPNCESGVNLVKDVINSHATPDGETSFVFKPYIWTGWEDGGIGVSCESDKNFCLKNPDRCVVFDRNGDVTNIRISLLDELPKKWQRPDLWSNNLKPIMYSFAFQPTPVKEFEKDNLSEWRVLHKEVKSLDGFNDDLLVEAAKKGVKWLILHEDWSLIQNYGKPDDEEKYKLLSKRCHELGMKVMVYFGYEISSMYPGFNDIADKYLNKNIYGNYVGGWQRFPMQRDYTVCYKGGYSDIFIKRIEYVMDELGFDGIYTDGTYVPWECANEEHCCGYRDDDGALHYTYPIYALREHVKKFYKAVHQRGGRIDTHQSSCCLMATLAFADSYYDGENIQPFLKKDIRNMKPDAFRAEFMGTNMGIPCNLISYTSPNFTIRMLAGLSLIHNVFPRAGNDLDFMSAVWNAYDDFGTKDATWHPYWKEQAISVKTSDTYLSYYQKDDGVFLIITSYKEGIENAAIELDKNYSKAIDILDGQEIKLEGKNIRIPMEFANVKLIHIK